MYKMNEKIESMYCIKCGEKYLVGDYFLGCPKCLGKGENAATSFQYKGTVFKNSSIKGMQKYGSTLPYETFPTLGEGDTPVVKLEKMAKLLGVKEIFIKNEFQNPTGSHKDRMSPLVVARALELGKKGIVAASSGNAGISIAAYAANSGLDCKIISLPNVNIAYKTAIEATGGELVIVDEADDIAANGRWGYMRKMVEEYDWYPATNYILPAVGSNCFGVQGYKTIAYEIYEEFGDNLPEYIFVPVSRGDLLWGIFEGFKELLKLGYIVALPKLVCVEPFRRISKVLEGEDYRKEFPGECSLTASIGGSSVTYQSYLAIRDSGGFAVDIPQGNVIDDVRQMAHLGLYLETSSAIVFSALKRAIEKRILDKNCRILIIGTSGGFKNKPEIFQK
ncbi:MAG: pyridoxal-phosphate dependent enzyme [Clostridiaceae bacterium]|nr:pyridoxal-phosphate dependent enzyme [Clostridiaceae bacterium]